MQSFIRTPQDLEEYLAPIRLDEDERMAFTLDNFQSRLAMEILQVRMRKQGQIFALTDRLVPCMIRIPDRAMWVSRSVIQTLNRQLAAGVNGDPVMQIAVMRHFVTGLEEVLKAGEAIEQILERKHLPTTAVFLHYVDTVTNYQSLGSLKFSFKIDQVKQALESVPGMDAEWCKGLCQSTPGSLFTQLYRRQLELLLVRLTSSATAYAEARSAYRKEWGFLEAEDLDFAEFDTDAFVDSKIEMLEIRFQGDPERVRQQLDDLGKAVWQSSSDMNRRMNDLLNAMETMMLERVRIYNLVRLWSSLLHHEEMNRWIKMRFLRNMHRLCLHGGFHRDEVGLRDLLILLHTRG
ncbi:MAG: hypothetical protein AB7T38_06795 [Nitrospirales bacterium]